MKPDYNKQKLIINIQLDKWLAGYENIDMRSIAYEDDNTKLENKVGSIIYDVFFLANMHILRNELENRRKRREEKERDYARKLAPFVNAENEKVDQAFRDAECYQKACAIRAYAKEYYDKVKDQIPSQPELKNYYDWLLARADWVDPLIDNDYSVFPINI